MFYERNEPIVVISQLPSVHGAVPLRTLKTLSGEALMLRKGLINSTSDGHILRHTYYGCLFPTVDIVSNVDTAPGDLDLHPRMHDVSCTKMKYERVGIAP
jgi:hypothetical protein